MNNFDLELLHKYLPKGKYEEAKSKLLNGYPVQYLIGNVDFYDCNIKVDENVLIPRFETEYLVDDLLKYINKYDFIKPNILDIGTGSGCISIALRKNIDSKIIGIDKNSKAINVAKKNARLNNVIVDFQIVDIHDFTTSNKYDVIVSNPPYIPKGDIIDEKTKYEPQDALFADDNGLYFYKLILEKSKELLNERNIIAFEIGHNQGKEIYNLAKRYYPNAEIVLKKDLNDFDRYIYIINE